MEKIFVINIHDTINPTTGNTYRQDNKVKIHNIALGTLVETEEGLRLYVVDHQRDCDGSPLYGLSFVKEWTRNMYGNSPQLETIAISRIDGGYSEECLKIIK